MSSLPARGVGETMTDEIHISEIDGWPDDSLCDRSADQKEERHGS